MGEAPGQTLLQRWQRVEWGTNLGSSNLWSVDLNDDGHEEIIFGGSGSREYGYYGSQFFAVLGYQQGDYNSVWTSRNYGDVGIKVIEVAETEADNTPVILVLLRDGRIEKYDGQALALIDSFKTQAVDARAMRWGDVDSDGAPEITIIGADYLHIYDASTHTLEWSSGEYGGRDVEVGDVDDDGAAEIVLDGYVLDGVTRSVEWQYQGGFGPHLELGDLTGDGVPEIIGMEKRDHLTVFDAVHRSPKQQLNLDEDLSTLLVTDISDDQRAEIIIGSGQWGSISAYGPDSLQNLWYINNPEHGTTNLAVGDPDSDGSPEVMWGAGHTSSGADYLYVGDVTTANIEWTSTDLDGPYMAGIADADTDTLSEITGASAQSNSGYDGGHTLVYDMPGHDLIRSRKVAYNGTSAFTSGDPDKDGEGEVIMASGRIVKILDAETLDQEGENLSLSAKVDALTLTQTDGDAPLEIIVGDAGGYVTVYDGATLTQEWKSISTGNAVIAVEAGDVDDDESLEIIFANKDSYVQIYDADSHYLEWQSKDLNASSLTLADTDQDGAVEILVGRYDGGLHTIESSTFQGGPIVQVAPEAIVSIAVANVDRSSSPELLIGSSRLRLMTLAGDSLLWESANIGGRIARRGDLIISDIDNDQFKDVLFGTDWGLFHYESSVPYPDFTPPTVIASIPDSGRTNVSRDVDIHVLFSELMDEGMLYSGTSLRTGNGEILSVSKSYDVDASRLTLDPQSALPPSAEIVLTVDGSVADTAGNTLDGNRNGISEGSPVDDFSQSFSTGTGVDVDGPVVSWSGVDPDSAWPGVPRTVTVQFSDTSSVAASTIDAAEAYVHGVDTTMAGRELQAVDGAFDEALEVVEFPLETRGMLPGLHAIYVRARDSRGQWGPLSRVDIRLVGEKNASNWPMFGQNSRHTGFNSGDSTSAPLALQWSKKISTWRMHPVAVYYDLVVLAGNNESGSAFVRGLDVNTGEPRWQQLLGNGVTVNPPSIGYGRVFIQTGKSSVGDNYQPPLLSAVNAQNGELLWRSEYSSQGGAYMSPTLWGGYAYVNGGYYGGMCAFDAFTGEEQWFVKLAQSDGWTPAVHDSITYAFVDGDLSAVDAVRGDILWQKGDIAYNWSGSNNTAPVISTATNSIFVTSSDYLHAINLDTRQVRWQRRASFGITPAVAKGRVFVVEEGELQVYDEMSGEQIWTFSGGTLFYPPVVTPSHVFVASRATTYALDRESREVVWDYNVGGPLTLANDQLFVAGTDGTLYSFVSTISDNIVEHTIPSSFNLHPGFPNPFRHSTTLAYEVPEPERVTLRVYDVLGRQVDVLVDAPHAAGTHKVKWKPDGHASGTYFCQMIAGPYRKVVPLTMVR